MDTAKSLCERSYLNTILLALTESPALSELEEENKRLREEREELLLLVERLYAEPCHAQPCECSLCDDTRTALSGKDS